MSVSFRSQWLDWRLPLLTLIVLLIVILPTLLLQQLFTSTLNAAAWVTHTHQVEAQVNALTVELREAEECSLLLAMGVDAKIPRERLKASPAVLERMLDQLQALTKDNADTQVRVGRLREIATRRIALATELPGSVDPRRAQILRLLTSDLPAHPVLQELLQDEQRMKAQRERDFQARREQVRWLSLGAMVLQLLLLVLIIWLLARQMGQRLSAEQASSRADARAASVLQTVREPIVVLDRDQRVLLHNAAFAELYAIDEDDLAERHPRLDELSDAWDDDVVRQRLADVLARGREQWDYEVQQLTRGSVQRTLLLNARRMALPDGGDDAVLMTLSDVTTQKTSQQRIIDLNRQLEGKIEQVSDVNRELEAFSYSVSHDLRAPLRHVSGFADKLARHLGEDTDERSRHYLQVIGDSARRMSALIDDLLVYSRLGRVVLRLQAVDMQSLVAETRSMLDAQVGADKHALPLRVDWDIDPLPILVGDENMLRQVWQNLLGNAVKYSGKREVAQIQVGYRLEGDGEHHFWVRDNGAGFDMAYAGKLFGVFQRLHKSSEYAGTGIGLASVRRVVTRHGGRVWAEAEPDQGATFHFVIPSSPDDAFVPRGPTPAEFLS
ncbi:ATP-binding protein [uncultured Pseudoxanthomonas sp.]|uniref:sensor histidine kinase n=1 Tax=uncultured Pseudoxanthomonas sp. TaxID=281701 RepID=UPI002594DC0A|nr:ATP-binding protein [uncultured Pseudoxanthomonas sp.]